MSDLLLQPLLGVAFAALTLQEAVSASEAGGMGIAILVAAVIIQQMVVPSRHRPSRLPSLTLGTVKRSVVIPRHAGMRRPG